MACAAGSYLPRPTQPALLYLCVPRSFSEEAAAFVDEVGDAAARDGGFRESEVRRLLRACFVRAEAEATDGARQVLEDGFLVLRMLAEQQRLQACSSLRVSSGVRIECHCALAEPPPEGDPGKNAFAYRCDPAPLPVRARGLNNSLSPQGVRRERRG